MSGGNRSGDNSPGLKRWLIPAAVFAAIVLSYGGIQHGIYYYEAASHAAAYSRDANNQIAAKCPVSATPADCEREIDDAAREDQRDEYDLYSQKAMALWTGVMGAMAIIGISLSGVGVYLIYGTWRQTADAAENSRKTLRSYIAKERALLVPQKAFHSANLETGDDGFIVELFNGGLAPATLVMTQWSYITERKWPDRFERFDTAKRTLAPDAKGRTPYLHQVGELDTSGSLYVVGNVRYETLESERFDTPFCYEIFKIDSGYQGIHWRAQETYVLGMPEHT